MWQIVNTTPFAAERTFERDINGAEVWIVSVKGTFLIHGNGFNKLAEKQMEVCPVPVYSGEPGKTSLLYESDMTIKKPCTDIILNGHAYSRSGKPIEKTEVILKAGHLKKTLIVYGDRYWQSGITGLKMTSPKPFVKMPIVYERAFGGVDMNSENPKHHAWYRLNPAGTGFALKSEHLLGKQVPNIENPSDQINSWKDRPKPAGFGAIAQDWESRLKYAGTYDEKWQNERFPLLPLDFNYRYYQCAPTDQQVEGYLKGGETVELYNLTPNGYLKFILPDAGRWMSFSTEFGLDTVEHQADLHTVIIEPDYPRVIMVWTTSLPCHNKDHKLERTVIAL